MLLIISASLLMVVVSSLLLFNYQRNQIIEISQSSATALSKLMESNLRHAMLSGDRELVNESIQAIMAERQTGALRILNSQGIVGASSVATEIGSRFTQADAICQACHAGVSKPQKESILYTIPGGRQTLLTVQVIRNQVECQTCHDSESAVLGLMILETSLTQLNKMIASDFWRTLFVGLAAFAVLISLIVPMINRRIIRPLENLSRGVAEISAGNLDDPVTLENPGDLGELAGSFDSMRQQLKITRVEMEHREQELAIMNEVGLAATQLLDLPKVLDFALDTITNRLGMADARIFLWDEEAGRYTMQAARGISQAQMVEIERRRQAGWDITEEVVRTGKEVFIPDMAEDERFKGVWENLHNRSFLNIPLLSRGIVIGSLGMVTRVGQKLTPRMVEFLVAVGREIGIAIDNAVLFAKTQQSEKQAIALYELGAKINASLVLNSALDAVAQAAWQLMEADISLVGLVDDDCHNVTILAAAGAQANKLSGLTMATRGQALWGALEQGQYVILEASSTEHSGPFIKEIIQNEKIASLLLVPLLHGERFLGIIEVMARQPGRFRPRHAQLLQRLAQKVAVSIENAQFYLKLRYMAALEERDRLAREMHDRLSQGLGYLKVRATITDDLLSAGQLDQARESLLELKSACQLLYTDVREEIFNLRTAINEHMGFFVTLQDYLTDYKIHYGLAVELDIKAGRLPEIAPEVAGQLLRIIQEALTNVRRHSGASSATIHCMSEDGWIIFCVEDYGQGFVPNQAYRNGGQHIGLQIMRERAESIGGSLELDSRPGQGTRVIVQAPVIRME